MALAPMILGAPLASMANTSATTDPVGFVKLTLEPGVQSVGISLLNPAEIAGLVESNTASTVTLAGAHSVEEALVAGTAYYLEVASGDLWEGERFEINVAGSSGSTLAIVDSSRNTVNLDSINLADHSICVRPHMTLAQVFDKSKLTGSASSGTADQVQLFDVTSQQFVTYFLHRDAFTQVQTWRQIGGGSTSFDNLVIPPGTGAFFRRNGPVPVELVTVLGEVRTNAFRQPLGAGRNLVSEGHPLNNSPANRFMTVANGFTASSSSGTADQVEIYDSATGQFATYWFHNDPFTQVQTWRRIGDGSTNHTQTVITAADKAVFIRKLSADPHYEAPKTF